MAFPRLYERTRVFVPADYTGDETRTLIPVKNGEMVVMGAAKQLAAYNGGGSDAVIIFGDGDDDNRYVEAGDIDETSATDATPFLGNGGDNQFLYEADDTLDVGFTANTSGTRNAGKTEFKVVFWRVWP